MFSSEKTQFAEGAFRVVADASQRVVAIVNVDYTASPSVDGLGLIDVNGEFGLLGVPNFIEQVFERELFVINQRLLNLVFESKYFHQAFNDGGHKVLVGRGTDPRDYSVGYVERLVTVNNSTLKVILCVGPEQTWQKASAGAVAAAGRLSNQVPLALDLLGGRDPIARQVERAHLLPARTMEQRRSILASGRGSIQYIAAILDALAVQAAAGEYYVRCDPAKLGYMFNDFDLKGARRYFAVHRSPSEFPKNFMSKWIRRNLHYLSSVVGNPDRSICKRK